MTVNSLRPHWHAAICTFVGTTTAAAAKSSPDGYTLIVSVSNHTTNQAMRDKMPDDALGTVDSEPWHQGSSA